MEYDPGEIACLDHIVHKAAIAHLWREMWAICLVHDSLLEPGMNESYAVVTYGHVLRENIKRASIS